MTTTKTLPLKKLTPAAYKTFPGNRDVVQAVFSHYFDKGFTGKRIGAMGKNIDAFNDAQKTLCLHYVCEGMIGGSGLYGILLETRGEFNAGYSQALGLIGDAKSKKLFDEVAAIYDRFEQSFRKLTTPPELNEGSKRYDRKLSKRLDLLQKKWYAGEGAREKLFAAYLREHKDKLVKT
jgi:hypothetical protein